MNKLNIAVIFGGQSSEHEVSCMSAANVIECIDTEKYNIFRIGITKQGHWVLADRTSDIKNETWKTSEISVLLSQDAQKKGIYLFKGDSFEFVHIDVLFPVLHGLYGEDGTIQGLFELSGIPYVGCGVLASAVSMDKMFTKIIVDSLGIDQAAFVPVYKEELSDMEAVMARVEAKLEYPVFVKPSRAGSSKGVNKARNRQELAKALIEAAENDRKVLVEETITGREIECAVLGNLEPKASGLGEILSADEFYDFDAKYYNPESRTLTDPEMPESIKEQIRNDAVKIFKAVDARGLSRVDFFLAGSRVVFNEINTLPGFTAISMYPMLWDKQGINKKELIETLIELAFKRDEI